MPFTLTVPGTPTGKARPRFANGRTFTPRETVLAEQAIRCAWEDAGSPRMPDGPVELDVHLFVERPQGHFKRDGSLNAEGMRNLEPFRRKPDLDNAVKLVMDALNGRAWRDDVQVVVLHARRRWVMPGTIASVVIDVQEAA
jgi:Holliday junction resolvase RusA-like endonuclease